MSDWEIDDTGKIALNAAGPGNIPVDIALVREVDDDGDGKLVVSWTLSASNYLPISGTIEPAVYVATCHDRELLAEIVRERWLPLYRNAVAQLEALVSNRCDDLYYWDGEVGRPETKGVCPCRKKRPES